MYGISVHNFRVLSHSTQALTQTQKHINSEKYELNISFSQKEKGKARIYNIDRNEYKNKLQYFIK